MARIRSIKPEFWTDYRLADELTRDQRLLYIGLWNEADDEGRFLAHPRRLLGAIFPYDRDLTESFIEDSLSRLQETGRLVLYEINGEPYAELVKFRDHQRINRPTPSRIPPPSTTCGDSLSDHGVLTESSSPRARAPEVEQGAGSMEQGVPPGDRAHTRDDPEPEEAEFEIIEDEPPLPEVPQETGAKVVPLRPRSDSVPFSHLTWSGRTHGSAVLAEWIRLQPAPPSRRDRDRFGRACKRIADAYTVGEIALAFVGMNCIWPFAPPPEGKGEPWTPEDLERQFAKALPAAQKHPQFKAQRDREEFDRIVEGGGW